MSEELPQDNRCQHKTASGRRCRLLRIDGDPSLCHHHRRQHLDPATDPESVAADLLGSIEDFKTATAVNQALGRLFALVAGNRIAPRNAAVLAYIAQLLLTTLPGVEHEITRTEGYDGRDRALVQAMRNLRGSKSSRLTETILKRLTEAPSDTSRTAS